MPPSPPAQQLPLLADESPKSPEQAVQQKARELYLRSRLLRQRYSNFEVLMADQVTGRSVRMAAAALVRSSQKNTRPRP